MSEHTCQKCGSDMDIPSDLEPTDYCNTCAQALVIELKAELERVQKQAAAMREALKDAIGLIKATPFDEAIEQAALEVQTECDYAISGDAGRDFISREQHLAIVRKFASGICSAHSGAPDADCPTCNLKLRLPEIIENHKAVWREQIKPLVSALKKAENAIQHSAGINDETRLGWALRDVDAALAYAHTLSL